MDTDGNHIIINMTLGRPEHRNVPRDPASQSLPVADQANQYNMVAVRRRVVEQTTNGAEECIDKMAKKYLGLDRSPGRVPGEKRVMLKIAEHKARQSFPPKAAALIKTGECCAL